MQDKKKKKIVFPKGFFTELRPQVNNEETFNDIAPINWNKKVLSGKNKAIVYSTKEKKVL